MAGYEQLIDSVQNLRNNVAIFRKISIHNHSVDSHDYGNIPGSTNSKPENLISELEYTQALAKSTLHMVGVTDHMKCSVACKVSETVTCKSLCVLPGMEVNFRLPTPLDTSKLHLLVIFPQKTAHEQICKILPPDMADERKRDGTEVINDDIRVFVKKVHECGGLCVAAHIDSHNGVRRNFRQLGRDGITFYAEGEIATPEQERAISNQFKDWLLLSGLDAIEVSKAADKEHYSWINEYKGQRITVAALLTGDSHRVQDIDDEHKVNYVKMTAVCFDDLKQALKFPDTRIRFPHDVPSSPTSRLIGMQIICADEQGFFKDINIAFSDNLTCLIGPRGSGKSTIIEAIRYVFGLNKKLRDLEAAGKELAEKAKSLQLATLTSCILRIVFVDKHEQTHVLDAVFDPHQDCTTKFFNANGEEKIVYDIETEYPIRLFGWSEIETLGRKANRQRDLLDRLILDFAGLIEKRKDLRSSLKKRRIAIESTLVTLEHLLETDNGEIKRFKQYQNEFDKLNTVQIKELFKDIDTAKAKIAILNKLKTNMLKWSNELDEVCRNDTLQGIDELLANYDEEIKAWWQENERKPHYEDKQAEVQKDLNSGINLVKQTVADLDTQMTNLTNEQTEKEKKLKEEVGAEAATQVAAELRRLAAERLDKVSALRRAYLDKWKELSGQIEGWKDNAQAIITVQDEISKKREMRKDEIGSSLNEFSNPQMKISVRFQPGRDKTEFIRHLYDSGTLNKQSHGNWKQNKLPERISLACNPIEMAQSIINNEPEKIKRTMQIDGQEYGIDEALAAWGLVQK